MVRRVLGLRSATAAVVASMVGTGAFVTTGEIAAGLAGPGQVLLVWLLGGLLAALGALAYGALGRRFPESGGEALFLARCWHPALGCMAGWVSLLTGFSAPLALAAWAFGAFLLEALPWGGDPRPFASLLILAAALAHASGVRLGAAVQDGAVFLKLLLLLFFLGAGLLAPPAPGTGSLLAGLGGGPGGLPLALVQVSFAWSGWNAAVYIASEVRDPERTLPRSLLLGCGLVAVLYLALQAVFLRQVPLAEASGDLVLARTAALRAGGETLAGLLTLLLLLALATTVSAMTMLGPRVYGRMAEDGFLPAILRPPAAGPPRAGIVLQAVLALGLLWSGTFGGLLTYTGFTLGLSAAVTVLGLLRLRRREGPERVPLPGGPLPAALFALSVVVLSALSIRDRPEATLYGLATLAFGLLVWRVAPGPRNRPLP